MIWGVDKLISKQVDKLIVAIIMSFVKFVVVNGTYHKVQCSNLNAQRNKGTYHKGQSSKLNVQSSKYKD